MINWKQFLSKPFFILFPSFIRSIGLKSISSTTKLKNNFSEINFCLFWSKLFQGKIEKIEKIDKK